MTSHTKGSGDVTHCGSTRDCSDYVTVSHLVCVPQKFGVFSNKLPELLPQEVEAFHTCI